MNRSIRSLFSLGLAAMLISCVGEPPYGVELAQCDPDAEATCPSGSCRVQDAPDRPTDDESPPEEGSPDPVLFTLTGEALNNFCNDSNPKFPERPGELCKNISGWGEWLMCHRKNMTDPDWDGADCREEPTYVRNRCAHIPAEQHQEKIKCVIENVRAWLGALPVCDEASACLLDLLLGYGYDCHREASDTHAWVVCLIDGVRHVMDGNNNSYYTCESPTTETGCNDYTCPAWGDPALDPDGAGCVCECEPTSCDEYCDEMASKCDGLGDADGACSAPGMNADGACTCTVQQNGVECILSAAENGLCAIACPI